MYKVLIAGGSMFNDYALLCESCDGILKDITDDITIVTGKAHGADSLGEKYAKSNEYPVEGYPALWNDLSATPCKVKYNRYDEPYNCLAGFIRNHVMVDIADEIIVFWDGKSHGTKDAIDYATKMNKPVHIINY